MSNLSELLPAGAGAKSATFVASGTLGSGVTVALKSNGQVAAISATGIPAAIGAEEVFNSATTASQKIAMLTATKAIVVYQDTGNSSYGTACILTVSGSTITAGTEVVFESASSNYFTVVSFTETQALVLYADTGNSSIGTYCLLTISGSTITAATPVAFMAGSFAFPGGAALSATQAIVAYMDGGNGSIGTAITFTLSGSSISVGTAFAFNTTYAWSSAVSKLTTTQAMVTFRDQANQYGTAIILNVSGSTVTAGTKVVFNSASTNSHYSDTLTAAQAIVAFRNTGNSYYGTSCVLNVSGSTITVGSAVVFETANADHIGLSALTSTRAVVAYADEGNSGKGTYCTLDVSGSTVTAGTPIVYNPTVGESLANSTAALTTSAFLVAYGDTGNSSYGTSIFIQTEGSNSASFIGITDQAIANTASGSVIVQGGVNGKVTGLTIGADYYVQADGSISSPTVYIPYDITSATYADKSFSIAAQETSPRGLAINPAGTKLFVLGTSGDDVNEYALSIAFDVSSASFTQAFSIASQDTNPWGITFNPTGTKMFTTGLTGVGVDEFALSSGFDVSTASFTQFLSTSAQTATPRGIEFNADGSKMFLVDNAAASIDEYTLSSGFNVSTASYSQTFSVSANVTEPLGLAFSTDGAEMFVTMVNTTYEITRYSLSTAFDISTASYTQRLNVQSAIPIDPTEDKPSAIVFNPTGTQFIILGASQDTVYQFTTSIGTTSTVPAGRALSTTSILLEG